MAFREILENEMLVSVRLQNVKMTSEFFCLLKSFYFDDQLLPLSNRMFTIVNISLLYFTSTDQITEFFEVVSKVVLYYPKCFHHIQFSILVNQFYSDNSLSKLLEIQTKLPSSFYKSFLKLVIGKIRINCSKVLIQTSEKIFPHELMTLLLIDSIDDIVH
jgi:hypothetical protein